MLLGMLTERDCLKVLVGGALDGLPTGKVSDYMTTPAQLITPTATLFDIAHIFLTRSYRKLPVVDRDRRVIGQVSRRDMLVAIESARDNPRLYGVKDLDPTDDMGVDSAMRLARRRCHRSAINISSEPRHRCWSSTWSTPGDSVLPDGCQHQYRVVRDAA